MNCLTTALLCGCLIGVAQACLAQSDPPTQLIQPVAAPALIRDAEARKRLLGEHKLTLQWLDVTRPGTVRITENNGRLRITGQQRGAKANEYLQIDGYVTEVGSHYFKFSGEIITSVIGLGSDGPCARAGEMTFRVSGKRQFWRLKEMQNPCIDVVDYVDVFFR